MKNFAGITFEELVQYIELKKKMKMTSGSNLHDCAVQADRVKILKIGDITEGSSNKYYVVVDMQMEEDGYCRGFGVGIDLVNNKMKILNGVTHFRGSEYVEKKLNVDITELEDYIKNTEKSKEIKELEQKIKDIEEKIEKIKNI